MNYKKISKKKLCDEFQSKKSALLAIEKDKHRNYSSLKKALSNKMDNVMGIMKNNARSVKTVKTLGLIFDDDSVLDLANNIQCRYKTFLYEMDFGMIYAVETEYIANEDMGILAYKTLYYITPASLS